MGDNIQNPNRLIQMEEDKSISTDNSLRPKILKEFIGQGDGKNNLKTFISSASKGPELASNFVDSNELIIGGFKDWLSTIMDRRMSAASIVPRVRMYEPRSIET